MSLFKLLILFVWFLLFPEHDGGGSGLIRDKKRGNNVYFWDASPDNVYLLIFSRTEFLS